MAFFHVSMANCASTLGHKSFSKQSRKLKGEAMTNSRMFPKVKPWNVLKGCEHACYMPKGCWAYQLATGRLKGTERYKDGFAPRLIEKELKKTFGAKQCIFVAAMGDLFGEWVPSEWIIRVLDVIKSVGYRNKFLLLTKNPTRYHAYLHRFSENTILGVTIETNRNTRMMGLTRAPEPADRYEAMRSLRWKAPAPSFTYTPPNKFVSIEPIIDFDHDILVKWIKDIKPAAVAVGYDNWSCGLPEPELSKTMNLIEELEKFTEVWRKTLREKRDAWDAR